MASLLSLIFFSLCCCIDFFFFFQSEHTKIKNHPRNPQSCSETIPMSYSLFIGGSSSSFLRHFWKKRDSEHAVISIFLLLSLGLWRDCVHSLWFDHLCLKGKRGKWGGVKDETKSDVGRSWTLPVVLSLPAQLGIIQTCVWIRGALTLKGSHWG